jgi:hypothetical protein
VTTEHKPRRYPRVRAQADNLGLGGLFIRTQNPPAMGTGLQLLFNAPEGEVRVRAIVRNLVAGRGMGVAIVSMEQEHRARLDRWVKKLAVEAEPVSPHA